MITTTVSVSTPRAVATEEPRSYAVWLTVERAAYIAIFLIAAGIRLAQLALRPLAPAEAADALGAWRWLQGDASWQVSASPLVFGLNLWTFGLLGTTDALARLWPALLGACLPLLVYPLRERLGRAGALVAALLLALSPHLVFFSRYLSGDSAVAFGALLALVSLARYAEGREARWFILGAVALGALLTAGHNAYLALVGLASLYFAWSPELREKGFSWPAGEVARRGLLSLALAFILAATAFMRRWDGVGDAANLLARWLAGFRLAWGEYPFHWLLWRLLLDEPLLAIGGLAGLVVLWRGRRRGFGFEAGLVAWAGGTLLVASLRSARLPGDLTVTLVPLALLTGPMLVRFLERFDWREDGRETLILLGAVLILAVMAFLWLAGYGQTGDRDYLLAFLAPVIILLGIVLSYAYWFRWEKTWLALGLAGLLILALVTVSLAWVSNQDADLTRRPAILWETSANDVGDLVDQVKMLSAQRVGDQYEIPLLVVGDPPNPVLAWYFRHFRQVRFVAGVSANPTSPAIITTGETLPTLGERYVGSRFPVRVVWSPLGLSAKDAVRWLLYRLADAPLYKEQVILWVERPG
jgi:uncharacterized protein (TIGR03663 family)